MTNAVCLRSKMNAHEKRGFSRVVGRRCAFSRFGDGNIRRQVSVDVFFVIFESHFKVAMNGC